MCLLALVPEHDRKVAGEGRCGCFGTIRGEPAEPLASPSKVRTSLTSSSSLAMSIPAHGRPPSLIRRSYGSLADNARGTFGKRLVPFSYGHTELR